MEKRYGATERHDRLMKIGRNKWELIYGYGTDGVSGWTYRERFTRKPTQDEIKEIIIAQINRNVEEKILCGLVWKDMPIWLSTENQFNYKAAYDLAVQTGGQSLPVKFKFGTDEQPVYHTFTTLDDLQEFYMTSLAFVQQVLDEGWQEKDNLDLSVFNQ
jgi:hypothetical protein